MTTTKTPGFNIRIDAFIPVDKKNFSAQAAAFALVGALQDTKKITPEFLQGATILDINAKLGTADLTAIPAATKTGDEFDPAAWPLTTDPLPEGATVLESTADLGGDIFQTIRLADGTETFRRISDEQDRAETGRDTPPQTDQGKGKASK